MDLSIEPLIYIGIFIGVIMLVEGVYLMVFGKSISLNSRVNRRLDLINKGGNREDVLANAPAAEHGFFGVPKVIE